MEPVLILGSSHPHLGEGIAKASGISLGKATIEQFPDGEIGVEILDSVRGREVFVLQSIAHRPNHYLMELCIVIDALKRASAGQITAVIPYFGYARQDRRGDVRASITAKLIADLLQTAGADHLVTVDLHAEQIQGFFDIPVDNLHASSVLLEGVAALKLKNGVVVSPDVGSIKIARTYADHLGMDFAVVDKERHGDKTKARAIIGDVKGKSVLITDDMCTTASTLCSAANALENAGAEKIYAAVSHGLFVKDALEELSASPIAALFVTDSVPSIPSHEKLRILSIAPLLGEACVCLIESQSLSTLLT